MTAHANCDHPSTKAARAACRKAEGKYHTSRDRNESTRRAAETRKINNEVRKGQRTHNPNTQSLYD